MIIESVLVHLLDAWVPFLYTSIFVGMMLEGELFLFAGAFLAHQGVLNMFFVLFLAGLGLIIGDFSWYFAGKYLIKKIAWLDRMSHRVIGVFDKHFEDRPLMTICASKLAYGIHRVILLRAGQKMPLKTYAKCILIADITWFVVVVCIAVIFSATIGPIMKHWLKYIEILVLLIILAFVFVEKILAKISEKFLE